MNYYTSHACPPYFQVLVFRAYQTQVSQVPSLVPSPWELSAVCIEVYQHFGVVGQLLGISQLAYFASCLRDTCVSWCSTLCPSVSLCVPLCVPEREGSVTCAGQATSYRAKLPYTNSQPALNLHLFLCTTAEQN